MSVSWWVWVSWVSCSDDESEPRSGFWRRPCSLHFCRGQHRLPNRQRLRSPFQLRTSASTLASTASKPTEAPAICVVASPRDPVFADSGLYSSAARTEGNRHAPDHRAVMKSLLGSYSDDDDGCRIWGLRVLPFQSSHCDRDARHGKDPSRLDPHSLGTNKARRTWAMSFHTSGQPE